MLRTFSSTYRTSGSEPAPSGQTSRAIRYRPVRDVVDRPRHDVSVTARVLSSSGASDYRHRHSPITGLLHRYCCTDVARGRAIHPKSQVTATNRFSPRCWAKVNPSNLLTSQNRRTGCSQAISY